MQFGLATVLVASAALLARILAAESRAPPGFATENRPVVQVRRPAVVDPGFRDRVGMPASDSITSDPAAALVQYGQ